MPGRRRLRKHVEQMGRQAKAVLQVAVQCYERAALLALLWNVYTETMEARLKQRDMEIQVGCHSLLCGCHGEQGCSLKLTSLACTRWRSSHQPQDS